MGTMLTSAEMAKRKAAHLAKLDGQQEEMLAKYAADTMIPVCLIMDPFGGAWEGMVDPAIDDTVNGTVHVYYHKAGAKIDPKNPKATRYCGSRTGIVSACRAMSSCLAEELSELAISESDPAPITAAMLAEDLDLIQGDPSIDSTTKQALINARKGQGKFRQQVLQRWGDACSVTGSVTQGAIRASHIKPWRESTNEERLDPDNGLPLVASLDALFDVGLISFESSGRLLVSSKLTPKEQEIFKIGQNTTSLAKKPSKKMAQYLAHHRCKHGYEAEG
jgi:HNH endonuclease